VSHDRLAAHFGDLPATLVELSSALSIDLPEGASLEAALESIHLRISARENSDRHISTFTGDAAIVTP
jgi:hypothetical protein